VLADGECQAHGAVVAWHKMWTPRTERPPGRQRSLRGDAGAFPHLTEAIGIAKVATAVAVAGEVKAQAAHASLSKRSRDLWKAHLVPQGHEAMHQEDNSLQQCKQVSTALGGGLASRMCEPARLAACISERAAELNAFLILEMHHPLMQRRHGCLTQLAWPSCVRPGCSYHQPFICSIGEGAASVRIHLPNSRKPPILS